MEISVLLSIVLFLSITLNIIFIWLIREQSSRLTVIGNNSSDLIELISSFRDHIKAVYSLDSFYGDATLEALMAHARSLSSLLEDQYGEIADLAEIIEYQEEETEDAEKEEEKEQHVFYVGTREGNS
jgi:hypothetical protein